MTREDRRSLALHRAIARRLAENPSATLDHAHRNLDLMVERNPHAADLLTEWGEILSQPVDTIVATMLSPDQHARDLRKVTPFAGVLTSAQRARVYRDFARSEDAT